MPYPQALALTLIVEVPVYVLAMRGARLISGWRAVAVAVGVNLVTHPLVWLTLTRIDGSRPAFLAAEVGAWLAETALLYLAVRRDLALLCLAALVANTASLTAGLALT